MVIKKAEITFNVYFGFFLLVMLLKFENSIKYNLKSRDRFFIDFY